jgi:hypothetical protein
MPGRSVITKAKKSSRKKNYLGWVLLIICSPVLLLVDAFRPRGSKRIFFAYICLMVLLFLIMTTIFVFMEMKTDQMERLLGKFFSFSEISIPVSTELQGIISGNAIIYDVNPQLITAMIQVESSFNSAARSPKGACGLMQITPLVWQYYNPNSQCDGKHLPGKPDHGRDCIYNIEANIATGVRYLKDLIDRYEGEIGRALEAYNAGLTNVDLDRVRPKYKETRVYLQRIGKILAFDSGEQLAKLYNFKIKSKALFRWLLPIYLVLWAILLIWVVRHLGKVV